MRTYDPSTLHAAKIAAARAAVKSIETGMLVGIGSGTTSGCFIEALTEKVREGLRITAVATSTRSADLAAQGGIEIRDINDLTRLDITVDGADEITRNKEMIKGGGGALLREKIIASMSDKMVVIIDPTKEVELLGKHPLPIEIIPFGYRSTIQHLKDIGFTGSLRHHDDGKIYITDGGHYIYDIAFSAPVENPRDIDDEIKRIPGVVETGFFFDLASEVIVGYPDGAIKIRT